MPLPAGTGLSTAARSSPAPSGSRSPSTAPARSACRARGRASCRRPPRHRPPRPCSSRSSWTAGVDTLSLLSPVGDPDYRKLRPKLALPDSGLRVGGDDRLRWHPSTPSFKTLHDEGKLTLVPAVGYRDADQSHFTSRHYWEVGATNPGCAPAGSAATSTGSDRPTTRCRDSRSTASSRPSLATGKVPVAALRGADEYSFWVARRLGRGQRQDAQRARLARRDAAAAATARSRQAGEVADAVRPAATAARAVQEQRPRRAPCRTRSTTATSPSGSPGSPRCSPPACPLRVVALNAYGMYDTHSEQPAQLAGVAQGHEREPAGLPARPRGARPRRPGAHARLVGVRPPRRGERLRRHRPRRRRHRSADRLARPGRSRRRAALRCAAASTATAICAPPSTTAASTARCSSSGSNTDAGGVIPNARAYQRVGADSMRHLVVFVVLDRSRSSRRSG